MKTMTSKLMPVAIVAAWLVAMGSAVAGPSPASAQQEKGDASNTGARSSAAGEKAAPSAADGQGNGASQQAESGSKGVEPRDDKGDVADSECGPEERALRRRVQARWDALLSEEYDKVYGLTTPSYREVFSKAHYLGRFGKQLKRDGIEIYKVEFQNEAKTKARVRVIVLFTTEVGNTRKQLRGPHWESWVKQDGQWWLVPKKR